MDKTKNMNFDYEFSELEPYIVEPGTKLDKVAEQMAKDKIGCALVAERGKLIGIYTSVDACRDLAKYLRA